MLVDSRRPPKNIWDVIFLPLGIAFAWYILSFPIFSLRKIGMPADTFFASAASEMSALLFFAGVGVVSVGPGALISNVVIWLIPLGRRQQNTLDGGEGDRVFREANKGLLRFSVVMLVLIYPISIVGGLHYYALAPDGVYYRPMFAVQPIHYEWRQVKEIETACYRNRKSINGQYFVIFEDGRKIDLIATNTRDFFSNYSKISGFLDGIPFDFHFDEHSSESCPQAWLPYFQKRPGN